MRQEQEDKIISLCEEIATHIGEPLLLEITQRRTFIHAVASNLPVNEGREAEDIFDELMRACDDACVNISAKNYVEHVFYVTEDGFGIDPKYAFR